jgi:hypothetical protein
MMLLFNTSCLDIKHKLSKWFQKAIFLMLEEDLKEMACCLREN